MCKSFLVSFVLLLLAIPINSFVSKASWTKSKTHRTFAELDGQNSGNSPNVGKWTPSEAADFVIWHKGSPSDAGSQLAPMIKHWSGTDVGEFMTRLYLGEVDPNECKISYCPSNVREPKWHGLERDGLVALEALLHASVPDDALTSVEFAKCAVSFLLKDHRWPRKELSKDSKHRKKGIEFEEDSFASLGHSKSIGKVLGSVRRAKIGRFTTNDVLSIIPSPAKGKGGNSFFRLIDFFAGARFELTSAEKVVIVERMALKAWPPAKIATFVGTMKELRSKDSFPKKKTHDSLEQLYSSAPSIPLKRKLPRNVYRSISTYTR